MILKEEKTTCPPGEIDWVKIRKIVRGTRIMSRWLAAKNSCLIESLTVYRVLCKTNIPCVIELGYRTDKNELIAHAWVKVMDKIIIGGPVEQYNKMIRTR